VPPGEIAKRSAVGPHDSNPTVTDVVATGFGWLRLPAWPGSSSEDVCGLGGAELAEADQVQGEIFEPVDQAIELGVIPD
jgi:hypothetical protein